jgi:two-component system, NtrC family, sensor histidine kinase GlrK
MKFTILDRLLVGYIAIMLLVIVQGFHTTLKLRQSHHLISTIDTVDGATIRLAERLMENLFSQIAFGEKYLLSGDKDYLNRFETLSADIHQRMGELEKLTGPDKSSGVYKIEELYNRYVSLFIEEAERVKHQLSYSPEAYKGRKEIIADDLVNQFNQIIQIFKFSMDAKVNASAQILDEVYDFTLIMAGAIILLGSLVSIYNTRSINGPITILKNKTREISEGNFDVTTVVTSPPEIAELDHDFTRMCERLKELEEMKINFVSHVSHELRTPLTVIKEASSMLLEDIFRKHHGKQNELFSIIHEECDRMIQAVNRILDLSRMEAKMMPFDLTEWDVRELIHKYVSKMSPLMERKNIHLDVRLSDTLPTAALDPHQIEQVMDNLLGNALKYTPDHGVISVRGSVLKNDPKYVKISVSDNGAGIAGKDLQKIFDKFHRIDNGRGTVRGTGLGLAIVKHIIDSHGGKIWAESMEGKGSTFYFTLPVYSAS